MCVSHSHMAMSRSRALCMTAISDLFFNAFFYSCFFCFFCSSYAFLNFYICFGTKLKLQLQLSPAFACGYSSSSLPYSERICLPACQSCAGRTQLFLTFQFIKLKICALPRASHFTLDQKTHTHTHTQRVNESKNS